ncbi:HNH endonuclease [Sphingomonas paucimobilis]|uniref:HNH endonuclease n=1 Tax=Sphingomonas paucimobilis TaxID=13689 RepID=UPI0028D1883C|nr:HNH endonuclease [Sphingomonas paucimobilis]
MAGRVKRKAGLAAAAGRLEPGETPACALCGRPLGVKVEWHHPVPKSEGGRETVPVHPICHRTIHATLTNAQLARDYADFAVLRAHPDMARFLRWIVGKPADFHAPTRAAR